MSTRKNGLLRVFVAVVMTVGLMLPVTAFAEQAPKAQANQATSVEPVVVAQEQQAAPAETAVVAQEDIQPAADSVAQIGDTTYATIEEAVTAANAASDAVTLELLADVTATQAVAFNGQNITLDLMGYTLDTASFGMTNAGGLSITDSGDAGIIKIASNSKPAFTNLASGVVSEISGGVFENGGDTSVPNKGHYVAVNNGEITTISGGTFTDLGNTSGASGFVNIGHIGTISGGTFEDYRIAFKNDEGSTEGTIDLISGGTFIGTANTEEVMPSALQNWGKIGSITGGTFDGGDYGIGLGTWNYTGSNGSGTVDAISGGTFEGGHAAAAIVNYDATNPAPSIGTISGGTFTSDTAAITTERYKDNTNPAPLSYTVAGGTFNGPVVIDSADTAVISGGAFETDVSEYVEAGSGLIQTDTGEWIVVTEVVVYRLYNDGLGEHLFTSSVEEVKALTSDWGWTYEGSAWQTAQVGAPVYRLYNPGLGVHLYTASEGEMEELVADWGWVKDNDGQPAYYSGGTVNVYRLYNEALGSQHLLTTSLDEYNALPSYDWNQEGVAMQSLSVGSSDCPFPEE